MLLLSCVLTTTDAEGPGILTADVGHSVAAIGRHHDPHWT
jgi:hypothetical protein